MAPPVAPTPPVAVAPAADPPAPALDVAPPVPPLPFGEEPRAEGSSDAQPASNKTHAKPALTRFEVDVDAGMGSFTAAPWGRRRQTVVQDRRRRTARGIDSSLRDHLRPPALECSTVDPAQICKSTPENAQIGYATS
jgi:hypothetical protein